MSGKGTKTGKNTKGSSKPKRSEPARLKHPDDPITAGEIRQYRILKGTQLALGSQDPRGEDLSDERIEEYIRQRRREAWEQNPTVQAVERKQSLSSVGREVRQQEHNAKYDRYLQEYLDYYKPETPNDRDSVHRLVAIKIRLEEIPDDRNLAKGDTKAMQQLAQEEKSLGTEFRALQKLLTMDKESRDKRKSTRGAMDIVGEMVLKAKDFLKAKMPRYKCPECHTEVAWLWLCFPELHWELKLTCGCGAEIVVGSERDNKEYVYDPL